MLLTFPPLCQELSHLLGSPPSLEREILYGRPHTTSWHYTQHGASAAEYSARNARKIASAVEIFFAMSLMTNLTLSLTLNNRHDDA